MIFHLLHRSPVRWALFALGAVVAVAIVVTLLTGSMLRQRVIVGEPVPASQRVSMDQIDHVPWNALLGRYAGPGVGYAAWQTNATDRRALEDYLHSLARADTSLDASLEARLAFWINAYNALTVYGILREYPTSSIRNHTPRFVGYHIWHDLLLRVGDQTYSLDQIEHKQLRRLGEPRIHFAIVCASAGCPPLRSEAYIAQRIDEQLSDNARQFFANGERFRFDPSRDVMAVSPILQWFAEDFGASTDQQLASIAPYLPEEDARRAASAGGVRLEYLDYDWSLNERSE